MVSSGRNENSLCMVMRFEILGFWRSGLNQRKFYWIKIEISWEKYVIWKWNVASKESVNVSIIFEKSRAERLPLKVLVLNIMGVPVISGKTQQRIALFGVKILCSPIQRCYTLGWWLGETGAIFNEQLGDLHTTVSHGKMKRRQTKPWIQGVYRMPLIKEFADLIDFAGFGGFMKLAILQILVNRETFPVLFFDCDQLG